MEGLYSFIQKLENDYEATKQGLQTKLGDVAVLSKKGKILIATGLARFTTKEATRIDVLKHLRNQSLSEADLRTVFQLNAKLNQDLTKNILSAKKHFTVSC